MNNQEINAAINMSIVIDEWKRANEYRNNYTTDFPSLLNLADGISLTRDSDVPFVGDTTLAGLTRSIPRDSLQQLPTFSVCVNGTKNSIPALFCSFLLRKYTFNDNTFGKGLLSTLQLGGERALAVGYQGTLAGAGSMYNDFGTSMRLLHYEDHSFEPGIVDHNETDFDDVTANLAPSRLRKILQRAQSNPNTTWNIPALQRLLDMNPQPRNYSQYESEARSNTAGQESGPTYEIVTRYGVGPTATILRFCPQVEDEPLQVMQSKSKFGYPRVQMLVIDPAPLHAFGTSRVRLASPNQNLMNIYYGNVAAMLLLNSKPPILKRGRFLKPVQLKAGAVWETLDSNAAADLKSLDNGSLGQFIPMAQQMAAQMQNIMGKPTGAIQGSNNTQGFSKTAPGVQMQQQVIDSSTNQITKIYENHLRQYALVSLDIKISESTGIEDVYVDDEAKDAINEIAPDTIGSNNKFRVNWEDLYSGIDEWSVDIEVSVSKDQLQDKERQDLQDTLVVLAQNAAELGPQAVEDVKAITARLLQLNAPLIGQSTTTSAAATSPVAPAQAVTATVPPPPAQ